jgi:hypothetical protein
MATRVSALNSTQAFWQDYELQGVRKDHVNSTSHGVASLSDLTVTESDTPANTVKIDSGEAYVNVTRTSDSANFTVKLENSAAEDVTINSNVSGNPRIDLVIARVDIDTDPNANADNIGLLEVVEGTPDPSPVAPATPANAIPLATVDVANGQTTFLDADITDARQEYYYVGMRAQGGGTGNDIATIDDIQIDASSTIQGTTKLSVDPAVSTEPIAVGVNDPAFSAISGLTATAAELNQVCDGVDPEVTAANLNTLTDGTSDGNAFHLHYETTGGDTLISAANTQQQTFASSYTKLKEITIGFTGTYTISFKLSATGGTAYGRVYKDGVAFGSQRNTSGSSYTTYTQNLAFTAGDQVQLYAYNAGGGATNVDDFQVLCSLRPFASDFPVIID